MKRIRLITFLLVIPLLAACREEHGQDVAPGNAGTETLGVAFSFTVEDVCYATRSATVSDESGIRDLNLFLYRNGKLEWQTYRTGSGAFSLNLLVGESYSAYALANVGERNAPAAETGIHEFVLDLSSLATGGRLPMATVAGVSFVAGQQASVTLPLTRLVAKYNFRVDKSALQTLLTIMPVAMGVSPLA